MDPRGRVDVQRLPCKTHIAHIVHIAWTRGSGGSAGWGPYSTYSTYSMELGESEAGCIAARRSTCVFGQGGLTSPARVQHTRCQSGRGLQRSVRVRSGKAGPGVANYWPLYKALKLSAMEIALSDPNFRFYCAVTSTRMQRFSTARMSASKTFSSGQARHLNPSRVRFGGRTFAASPKLWWSFARFCTVMILNVSAGTFTS